MVHAWPMQERALEILKLTLTLTLTLTPTLTLMQERALEILKAKLLIVQREQQVEEREHVVKVREGWLHKLTLTLTLTLPLTLTPTLTLTLTLTWSRYARAGYTRSRATRAARYARCP